MKLKSLVAGLSLALACQLQAAAPRYVFYFIGDGMGIAPTMAAANYQRIVLGDPSLLLMQQFPVASSAMSWSASGPVTDSAAAGTALSSGYKTINGMIGVTPDSIAMPSLADAFKQAGYGVGVVTTVAPDDATPGAFYAHVPYRGMYTEIEKQFVDGNVDFLGGAGLRGATDKDGKSTGVLEHYAANNVSVAYGLDNLAEMLKSSTGKVVLLDKEPFSASNSGYTIDSIPGVITLPQYTTACLDYLESKSPERFFMMVEGGNIDHALHANDGGAAIIEILNFNEALAIAYDFMQRHPEETLIVVTADHDTGGLSVGCASTGYNAYFDMFKSQRMSKEMFSRRVKEMLDSGKQVSWEEMQAFLRDNLGFWENVKLNEKQTARLEEAFEKTFVRHDGEDEKTLYADFNAFSSTVFDMLQKIAGIGWTTGGHSGNPVPVYAAGVGAERFTQFTNNTNLPTTILQIAEIEMPK